MAEHVPRRMRRFHRAEPTPEEVTDLHSRDLRDIEIEVGEEKPRLSETDIMSESLFEQLQRESGDNAEKETVRLAMHAVRGFKKKHKRYPKGKEYDEIAENIYEQFRNELVEKKRRKLGRRKRARKRDGERRKGKKGRHRRKREEEEQVEAPPKKATVPTVKPEDLKVEDLFGETGKTAGAAGKAGDEFSLTGLEKGMDLEKAAEEEKQGCPNCNTETEKVLYCPQCGNAFCPNCAKEIKRIANKTIYICPSCGKRISKENK